MRVVWSQDTVYVSVYSAVIREKHVSCVVSDRHIFTLKETKNERKGKREKTGKEMQ